MGLTSQQWIQDTHWFSWFSQPVFSKGFGSLQERDGKPRVLARKHDWGGGSVYHNIFALPEAKKGHFWWRRILFLVIKFWCITYVCLTIMIITVCDACCAVFLRFVRPALLKNFIFTCSVGKVSTDFKTRMWGQRSVVVNVVTKYQHWTVEWSAVVVVKVWGHMQGRVCSESQFYEMSRYSWRKKNKNKKKEKKRKNGKKKEEGKEKLWEQASSSLGLHKGLCAWKLFLTLSCCESHDSSERQDLKAVARSIPSSQPPTSKKGIFSCSSFRWFKLWTGP